MHMRKFLVLFILQANCLNKYINYYRDTVRKLREKCINYPGLVDCLQTVLVCYYGYCCVCVCEWEND